MTQVFDISIERMTNSFQQMQYQAKWDVSKKMLWGYFFLDTDPKELEEFSKALTKEGLNTVEIRQTEGDQLFLLHVEEQVVHSPDSLFARCHQLAKLAQDNAIATFDGWDVEPSK